MDDLKSAASLTQTLSGKPSPINTADTTKPGNLYIATNPPGTGQLPRPGFDNTKFARIAGALGAALAEPGSWQERVGGTAALLAGEEIKRKRKAPDEALARKLIEARIEKLRTPDKEDIPSQWESFYEANKGKLTPSEMVRKFEGLSEEEKEDLTFEEKEKIKAKHRKPSKTLERFEKEEKIRAKYRKKAGEKPMTEKEARNKLMALEKYAYQIESSGGMTAHIYNDMIKEEPDLAVFLKEVDKSKIGEIINKRRRYLNKFIPKDKNDPFGIRQSWKDYQ